MKESKVQVCHQRVQAHLSPSDTDFPLLLGDVSVHLDRGMEAEVLTNSEAGDEQVILLHIANTADLMVGLSSLATS